MSLKANLSTTSQTSDPVLGSQLIGWSGGHQSSAASYQVKYGTGVTTGNFSVDLEAGFDDDGTITWGTVATITQADVNDPATLPISPSLHYRFNHGSGVNVRVILG